MDLWSWSLKFRESKHCRLAWISSINGNVQPSSWAEHRFESGNLWSCSWKYTRAAREKDYDVYGSCQELLSLLLLLFSVYDLRNCSFAVNLNSDSHWVLCKLKRVQLVEEANTETTCISQHRQNKRLRLSPRLFVLLLVFRSHSLESVISFVETESMFAKLWDMAEQQSRLIVENREKHIKRPNQASHTIEPWLRCFRPFPSFTSLLQFDWISISRPWMPS